ncbi:hypothetical protein HYE67_003820 [Fusarium culmorum]|uniref:Uncharacterized protein n=1 Tax=Fusarium culmorum TaxID=5516 RepID=A0A2T4GQ27_FUSCU|nr:hypothetical protein FCULG_00000986 [Fusarium culmorum]QPC61589.1 hypothetical protein HYE67_003820 [Fusarium culmorum]
MHCFYFSCCSQLSACPSVLPGSCQKGHSRGSGKNIMLASIVWHCAVSCRALSAHAVSCPRLFVLQ